MIWTHPQRCCVEFSTDADDTTSNSHWHLIDIHVGCLLHIYCMVFECDLLFWHGDCPQDRTKREASSAASKDGRKNGEPQATCPSLGPACRRLCLVTALLAGRGVPLPSRIVSTYVYAPYSSKNTNETMMRTGQPVGSNSAKAWYILILLGQVVRLWMLRKARDKLDSETRNSEIRELLSLPHPPEPRGVPLVSAGEQTLLPASSACFTIATFCIFLSPLWKDSIQ